MNSLMKVCIEIFSFRAKLVFSLSQWCLFITEVLRCNEHQHQQILTPTSTEVSTYPQTDMYKNGHISFIHNSQI